MLGLETVLDLEEGRGVRGLLELVRVDIAGGWFALRESGDVLVLVPGGVGGRPVEGVRVVVDSVFSRGLRNIVDLYTTATISWRAVIWTCAVVRCGVGLADSWRGPDGVFDARIVVNASAHDSSAPSRHLQILQLGTVFRSNFSFDLDLI